jgi:Tfp pilus assembly protein PilN
MKAVNLIPGDDRGGAVITAGRSGGGVFVVAALLAGLALLALLYGLADHQISHDSSEVTTLTARAQQAQVRAGELAPYTSFLQMREQRVQAVAALVGSRFDWAQAFHELGRVLPAGKVSLGSIEGTVGSIANATPAASSPGAAGGASGSSVTSATPPGSIPTFKLTGCAVSQAEVALMLQRLRLIDGVNEVSLQSSTQGAASAGAGSGCEGGNPAFTAQVTFDALPAVPTPSSSTTTSSTVAASTSATTPASAPVASAPTSSGTPASNASGAKAPAGSAASTSSSEAVR